MASTAYENELEQQFGQLPGFLQDVLREPFNWIDGVLKDIAGNPQQLLAAGEHYAAMGKQVSQLSEQAAQDRQSILSGAWEGQAYQQFSSKLAQAEQQITALGQSIAQTQPLLESAAQACAESASAIVSIVEGVVSFLLQDAIISGVTAVISFGASAAAGAAAAVAKAAEACEEIGGIVARLTSVLEKVAAMLEKIAAIVSKAERFMKELQEALKASKGLKPWLTKSGFITKAEGSLVATGVRTVAGEALVGSPFPGIAGGVVHAAEDGYKADQEARQAGEQQQ